MPPRCRVELQYPFSGDPQRTDADTHAPVTVLQLCRMSVRVARSAINICVIYKTASTCLFSGHATGDWRRRCYCW